MIMKFTCVETWSFGLSHESRVESRSMPIWKREGASHDHNSRIFFLCKFSNFFFRVNHKKKCLKKYFFKLIVLGWTSFTWTWNFFVKRWNKNWVLCSFPFSCSIPWRILWSPKSLALLFFLGRNSINLILKAQPSRKDISEIFPICWERFRLSME